MYGTEMDAVPFPSYWEKSGGRGGNMRGRVRKLEEDVAGIRIDIAVIKSNYVTKQDLGVFRDELKGENSALRAELKGDNRALREELKGDNSTLKEEINELKIAISDTRTSISDAKNSTILWVVSAVIFAQIIPTLPAILKVLFPS